MESNDNDFLIAHNRFIKNYNILADKALESQKFNNNDASDINSQIANEIGSFLNNWSNRLTSGEFNLLKNECVARSLQALLLKTINLSGFVDLSLNLSSSRNLIKDLEISAQNSSGSSNACSVDGFENISNLANEIKYEDNCSRLNNLIGYQDQCRAIIDAYFIIQDTSNAITSDGNNIADSCNLSIDNKKVNSNVILYGPPGTGKTTSAISAAGTLGIDIYIVNAENILSSYRSESEKNIANLYNGVRRQTSMRNRNAILLIDEIDGLIRSRTSNLASGSDYSLLTKFLQILEPNDGSDNSKIMSIFTTNFLSNLDSAFIRRCTTVFMGYIEKGEDRMALCGKMYTEHVIDNNLTLSNLTEMSNVTKYWVPGDHVNFIRDIIKPMRLKRYTDENPINYLENNSRFVSVNLPKLLSEEIIREMQQRVPITSPKEYKKYTKT